MKDKYKNGIIIEILCLIIKLLHSVNLVEFVKYLFSRHIDESKKEQKIKYENIGIDVFIFIKWAFILIISFFNINNCFILIVVWYLIVSNLFTYFYYHLWEIGETRDYEHQKRRFASMFIALWYSIVSFAYLYLIPYREEMRWEKCEPDYYQAILYSFSNSFAANYAVVSPITNNTNVISNIELLITIIFISVILNNSIPSINASSAVTAPKKDDAV